MKVEFCLPVYNEEEIVQSSLLAVLAYCKSANFNFSWVVTVAINGSVDKTEAICTDLLKKYPEELRVNIYNTPGKGLAIIKTCLESRADVIVYMDIDLSTSLGDIPSLMQAIENGCDLAIGSRLMSESITDRSFIREVSSRSYNFLSRLLLKHRLTDLQCGFKACRVDAFKKIAPYIKDNGWFFDTELVFFASYLGFRIAEVPISWSENNYQHRKSKIRLLSDSIGFIKKLLYLKARVRANEIEYD